MSKKPLSCRHCKSRFPRTAGAGLFCGDDCEKNYCGAVEANRKTLTESGFEQHPETSNIWTKDGASITEEQVKHDGMDKAIRRHGSAVAEYGDMSALPQA